ncbi:6725_t:CDS:1 [Racocetra fulgida]|uniref:6725_t:CDS:1 n=1 Tax=Racocetra fulgida TaxID=60492 RepID=A0A9N9H3P6_9GLOM|nr:6725_t:CDS:1 [Racocetra fulgida]
MDPQVLDLDILENLNEEEKETHKGQHLIRISSPLSPISKQIVFAINDTFPNWLIAEHYVTQYGHQKGFVAIKIRNKTDNNGGLTNLYYKCEFGSIYQQKKSVNLQSQYNKDTKKLNCKWKLNLLSATDVVRITSFYDQHVEHQLSSDIVIFASINRRFSNEYCKNIRHLLVDDQCDLSTIWSLISVKYPNQLLLTRNLANVVT